MSYRSNFISADVDKYLNEMSSQPDEVASELIGETRQMLHAMMQIGSNQAAFMELLVRVLQPKLVVEIGTFTGYSAMSMAKSLPKDGRIVACDIHEGWTDIAKRYWQKAGVGDSIELRLAPAIETLASFPEGTQIDLAFIDADKTGYWDYLDAIAAMMGPKSVVLVDNVLWSGRIVEADDQSDEVKALRAFNERVLNDERFDVALLPVGDGLSFITLAN